MQTGNEHGRFPEVLAWLCLSWMGRGRGSGCLEWLDWVDYGPQQGYLDDILQEVPWLGQRPGQPLGKHSFAFMTLTSSRKLCWKVNDMQGAAVFTLRHQVNKYKQIPPLFFKGIFFQCTSNSDVL